MRERRDGLRFALESRERGRIACERRRQDLDGDVSIELRVAGFVDLAHPPGTEGGEHFVSAEACAGREAHGRPIIDVRNI